MVWTKEFPEEVVPGGTTGGGPDLLSMQDDHFQYDDQCDLERCDDRYDREI